ncbi:MAG: Gfo/Idh/MocA family oxidoreductase, partial [Planctomycetaceae bacterium]|nr:Gfo/Idh/MocA family oxidoreductase [Planctomycetaceae bacterium]
MPAEQPAVKPIATGVITQAKGAHLGEFFQALADSPAAGTVAVADDSGESEALAGKILKQKLTGFFRSSQEMLARQKPRFAVVSMESVRAPAEIRRCLEAGSHVLTEKPACTRAEDFEPLTQLAEMRHLNLALALANRPHAPIQEARRLLQKQILGRLYGIEMHLVADQSRLTRDDYQQSWRCDRERSGGGHLAWLGIHWIDTAQYITGLKIRRVAGFTENVGGQPITVEDSAAMALEFDGGIFGTLTSGFYLDRHYKFHIRRYHSHMRIWGSHGWLELSSFEDQPLIYASRRLPDASEQIFQYPAGQRSYTPFVNAAVQAA